MSRNIINRVLLVADHVINTGNTIRETASFFNISKSTVHKDLKERLLEIDINKYTIVKKIMEEHINTRHIRGGEATRKLFFRKNQLTL